MKPKHLLLLGSLLQFLFLMPLALWARKRPAPLHEVMLTRALQKRQKSWKRSLIVIINTLTGSAIFLNVLVVPISIFVWKKHLRREALAILTTCWLSILANTVIKRVVSRPRPPSGLVHIGKQSRGKSFPSGHVATAVCLWGWVTMLGFAARGKMWSASKWLLCIPALFIAFTGPARVYLGDHWTTDVLGGYLFGGGCLSLSLSLYLQLQERV